MSFISSDHKNPNLFVIFALIIILLLVLRMLRPLMKHVRLLMNLEMSDAQSGPHLHEMDDGEIEWIMAREISKTRFIMRTGIFMAEFEAIDLRPRYRSGSSKLAQTLRFVKRSYI